MYSRLLQSPKNKSFFLFGPRGTGKTTWVKATFPEAVYVDLLEAEVFNDLLANPQRLENFIPKNFKGRIIIDEIQKVPSLLDEVHRLIWQKTSFHPRGGNRCRIITLMTVNSIYRVGWTM